MKQKFLNLEKDLDYESTTIEKNTHFRVELNTLTTADLS